MRRLFTERHGGAKPRTAEQLDATTRDALLNLLASRIDEAWFGHSFSDKCPDGYAYAGTDRARLARAMNGFGLPWPADALRNADAAYEHTRPTDGLVFDLIRVLVRAHRAAGRGLVFQLLQPHPLRLQPAGRPAQILRRREPALRAQRHGLRAERGEVIRLAPAGLQEALASATFHTGDAHLDEMLKDARTKILHRDLKGRRESLEELWDAWERLKTIEPGASKPDKVKALLDKAAIEPTFWRLLETEAPRAVRYRERLHDPPHRDRQDPGHGLRPGRLSLPPDVRAHSPAAEGEPPRGLMKLREYTLEKLADMVVGNHEAFPGVGAWLGIGSQFPQPTATSSIDRR